MREAVLDSTLPFSLDNHVKSFMCLGQSLSLDKYPREFYDPWPRDVRVFGCYDSSANTKFNVSYHVEIVSRYIYNSISGDLYNVTIYFSGPSNYSASDIFDLHDTPPSKI